MHTQKMEHAIITAAIKGLLEANYKISIFDGEETALKATSDSAAILGALFATDEETLIVHSNRDGKSFPFGSVQLIYGNDGYDVIADYTTSLETALTAAIKLGEKYESEQL